MRADRERLEGIVFCQVTVQAVLKQIQRRASVGASIRTPAHFIVSGGFPATMCMPVSQCIRFFASRIRRRSQQKSRRSASAAEHVAGGWWNRKSARRRRPARSAKRLLCIQHERGAKPVAVKSYWFLILPCFLFSIKFVRIVMIRGFSTLSPNPGRKAPASYCCSKTHSSAARG